MRIPAHFEGLLSAIRPRKDVVQLRLDALPSLPSGPVVERRDLAVYDTLLEQRA